MYFSIELDGFEHSTDERFLTGTVPNLWSKVLLQKQFCTLCHHSSSRINCNNGCSSIQFVMKLQYEGLQKM